MSAKYEIFQGQNAQYYFRLKAANNEVILASEGYTSKANCHGGILSVRKHAGSDENYERRSSKNNQPYFVLKAANHQIIGVSEMYSSKQGCEKGIASVKKNAPQATVNDLTQ